MCMTNQIVLYTKKGKVMHSLSVSVFPCLSETVCNRTFCMLHRVDMLSCPDIQYLSKMATYIT